MCTTPPSPRWRCAQGLIWGGPCAQRLVSPGGALRTTLCVMGGRVRNALCRATPCVTEGGPVHNALCHRGCLCTTPCVTGGGPVHNALCHSGGGACACGLVSGSSNGLLTCQSWAQIPGEPCARRLVSLGGVCATPCDAQRLGGAGARRLVSGAACARRLVSPGGGLCTTRRALRTTPCVTAEGPAHNALCRATPCVTEGGPVHNALCHRGCLCTAPCVTGGRLPAQRFVSRWRGGPVLNALCYREGGCAQRVCDAALCRATPCVTGSWVDLSPCSAEEI